MVEDARRFLLSNRWIIDHAPLQTYSSALVFSPMKSIIRGQFQGLMPQWITRTPVIEEHWSPELFVLEGHTNKVLSIAFSPVGNHIASASLDGTTRVWDAVTGAERFKFVETDGTICDSVAFSPDGKTVASGLSCGLITLREFATGRTVELNGHTEPVIGVAFSPTDGNLLASTAVDKTVSLWSIDERRQIYILDTKVDYWCGVAFTPDGRFVAAVSSQSVCLWDIETGELSRTFEQRQGLQVLEMSMDGETIALRSWEDSSIGLWNAKTGVEKFNFQYDKRVVAAAFSPPDGKILAVGLYDGTINFRRTDTWEDIGSFTSQLLLRIIAYSPDGRFLATSSEGDSHQVSLWDTSIYAKSDEHKRQGIPAHSVGFLPGGDNIVWSNSNNSESKLWDVDAGTVRELPELLNEVVMSPDGEAAVLILQTSEGVQVWDSTMANELARCENETLKTVVFSPGGTMVALISTRRFRILERTTWKETAVINTCEDANHFAFSPNNQMAGWVENEGLHLWDLAANKEHTWPPYQDVIPRLTFSPGFRRFTFSPNEELLVAFGVQDSPEDVPEKSRSEMLLLVVATGVKRATLTNLYLFDPVIFHPSGDIIAGCLINGSISVRETSTGRQEVACLGDGEDWDIFDLNFSPTDKITASGTKRRGNAFIRVWNIVTGTEIGRFAIHRSTLRFHRPSLSFSHDGWHLKSRIGQVPLCQDAEEALSFLYLGRQWVVQGHGNLLWLPPAYRAVSLALRGKTVVLGHESGAVTFFEFDLASTPVARARWLKGS